MGKSMVRMGVDIGGTFTDVVLEVGDAQYSTKVLTTYVAPEDAIIDGMQQVCRNAGITPADIGQIIHGTTLATNALIERRGAKTALVTTRGFRDVIEMRTESRFEQYDLDLTLPEPLLSRQQRYTIPERIGAQGDVLVPLDTEALDRLVDELAEAGYESIAVGLIHSYLNDTHERQVQQAIADRLPDVMISLSSEVSPQMREYERFNTVVANAYIKPLMKSYLGRLQGQLRREGVDCSVFLMHSGGGIISIDSAAEFPVRLVESGPAGGAVFAANIAARHGLDKVLSFDMGGTTAKICLIRNQTPKTSRVFEVARTYRFKKGSGMPISIPVIDMVEIGAGGGSLASVDAMRQIRVGPQSAGSEPGPACYGRGGDKPAVTDADLVLGKLDADNFAGGSITLHTDSSINALEEVLGKPLGMDAQTAAYGLVEVVDENMANAARVHAVENGEDLSDYTMIAFGGAAPLHAARLCEKLGVQRLLVPPGAGVGSAIGFLRAPFSFEANRSQFMKLSAFDSASICALLSELQAEATSFVRSCDSRAPITTDFKAYMRYTGQGWEIPVNLTAEQARNPTAAAYQQLFEADYEDLFGRTVEGMDIEITVWAANATTTAQAVTPLDAVEPVGEAVSQASRQLFDAALGKPVSASVVLRDAVQTGQTVAGPAIITEDETTIIVPLSRTAIRQPDGCIDLMPVETGGQPGHGDFSQGNTSPGHPSQGDAGQGHTNQGHAPQGHANRGRADQAQAGDTQAGNEHGSTVVMQVMWNRLISVVEEQAQALVRTAFSTSVREAGDLSAGVYDTQGRMLAQAVTGTPGHVNAMADAVPHFMRRIGMDNIHEGDIYITNDPWEGTGHLHDITVVTPSFHRGRFVGFFACTAHIVDIGGRGFGADANSIYEEGLYIPIMKFADKGKVDQTLIRIVRGNVREPDQLVGDINALATCNEIGHRRLADMMNEFALDSLDGIAGFILDNSRRATLERINALPPASATGSMTIDGFSRPIDLKVTLEFEKDRILCSFDGSSPLDKKGINVPLVYTKAYACYALKCAIAPEIPNNYASLLPFEITAPENSIVNAVHPAPVALRHVIGHMIPDTVYDALDKMLPETVPAEGAGTLCNFQVSLRPRTDEITDAEAVAARDAAVRAEVLTFNSGGSGARPRQDGMNATAFPSGVMTMPIEATEHTGPVIIWRKELRPDSGGVGKYQGGLGQYMEVGAVQGHEFDFQAMFDRVNYPARGRQQGGNGAPTVVKQDDGTPMRGKGKQFVPHGRRVMLEFPGGAGYGNPAERDAALVRRDLARGYITPELCRSHYGFSEAEIDAVLEAVRRGEDVS